MTQGRAFDRLRLACGIAMHKCYAMAAPQQVHATGVIADFK